MDCFSSYDCSRSCALASSGAKDKKCGGKRGKAVKLSTDAQSVAARERRHRISERFKILQSLVPGGSKMDTVSMLEEAIHYVKFLKTQIWLHQTMINFVDGDPPISLPAAKQLDAVYAQVNMGGGTDAFAALPEPGLAHSDPFCEDNTAFDASLLY